METKYVDRPTGDLCTNVSDVTAMQQRQAAATIVATMPNDSNYESSEFLISNNTVAVSSGGLNGVDTVKVFDGNGDYVDTVLTDTNHSGTRIVNADDDSGGTLPCTTDVSFLIYLC